MEIRMKTRGIQVLAVCALVGTAVQSWAGESFQNLLNRVPGTANVLLLVDVNAVHKSRLGVKEGWEKQHEQNYTAGIASIPPFVNKLVMGSYQDPVALENLWQVAVADIDMKPSINDIAQREGGTADQLAGQPIVLSPRQAYFTLFGPQTVGVMRPANRQETARWLRFASRSTQPAVSPYLQSAAATMGDRAHLVLAFDTADILDLAGLRNRLKQCKALADKPDQVDRLAKLFAGLKGARFTIWVDDVINGDLRLDFSDSVDGTAAEVKAVVLEALNNIGLRIADLDKWLLRAPEDKALTYRGMLTQNSLRRLLTPILTPAAAPAGGKMFSTAQPGQTITSQPQDVKTMASQRYFHSTSSLLDDLRNDSANTYNRLAYLHNKYSQMIDALPMLNVDPELLDWGAKVSSTLRALGNLTGNTAAFNRMMTNNMSTSTVYTPNAYSATSFGPGWNSQYSLGGYQQYDNRRDLSNYIAAAGLNESAVRLETWKNIDDATSKVRRDMTSKYNVEFK